MDLEYTLIRSKRKSISVELDRNAKITVRAPLRMSEREITGFLREKEAWILKNRRRILNNIEETEKLPKLTEEELKLLYRKAKVHIPERVRYYAGVMGVTYNRIAIRTQRTRWGSCSSKGNLNFNCLLMLMPQEVIDYIVVHELAHRREMNHSSRFYEIVREVLPDYKARERYLKNEGSALLRRL